MLEVPVRRRGPRSGPRLVRRLRGGGPVVFALAFLALALCGAAAAAEPDELRGLPSTRSYAIDEIGYIPRGSHLGFDRFGRLSLVHSGVYVVLNDTTWLRAKRSAVNDGIVVSNVVTGRDGRMYYGARGSWGLLESPLDGEARPVPLVPPDAPKWTATAAFEDLLCTGEGTYFIGPRGVIFRAYATGRTLFFECAGSVHAFAVGDRVFVSGYETALAWLDSQSGQVRPISGREWSGNVIEFSARLDNNHTLLALRNGSLVTFDGERADPWSSPALSGTGERISALEGLPDGAVAAALPGKGLFVFSADGALICSLSTPRYHRVTRLASREPGVLWAATEDTIEKVLYRSPLTTFGQQLGLPASWPIVVRWLDRILVSTSGKLYTAVPGASGGLTRFEPFTPIPPNEPWSVASNGTSMLMGNPRGIVALRPDGTYTRVAGVGGLAFLSLRRPDQCFAVGTDEIALLEEKEGRWQDSGVPRIPGIPFVGGVYRSPHALWIEMGSDGIARLTLEAGRLKLEKIALPWSDAAWTSIGVVDDLVVVTGAPGHRAFFDDRQGRWTEAPELRQLLARSPYWLLRVRKDESGTLWATHSDGVVTFTSREGGYEMDASSFDLVNDRFPQVQILPHDDIWFSAGRALHHVQREGVLLQPPSRAPQLIRVDGERSADDIRLPYRSSLGFRVFSGSYRWMRAPTYEYRLGETGRWTTLDTGAVLSVGGLHEGPGRLEVRVSDDQGVAGPPAHVDFEVLPPWYRTWQAFAGYVLLFTGAFYGAIRLSGHLQRQKNLALERTIRERTRQLEETMEKLNDETRNAATLAERNRLAGEIHDSLQQGLSGAILQLDSTLLLPGIAEEMRERLNVVRNMISYTRHEVQHAVWDLESPLLEGTELGAALQKLADLINSGPRRIEVSVSGKPVVLAPGINHHLIRIAQEATTNSVRHANAQHIAIRLDYTADRVNLAIEDDGVGFLPAASLTAGHFGLRGIRARVKKLHGEVDIQSTPGKGTCLRVSVPLTATMTNPPHAEARA